jgi:hypothetical protein
MYLHITVIQMTVCFGPTIDNPTTVYVDVTEGDCDLDLSDGKFSLLLYNVHLTALYIS